MQPYIFSAEMPTRQLPTQTTISSPPFNCFTNDAALDNTILSLSPGVASSAAHAAPLRITGFFHLVAASPCLSPNPVPQRAPAAPLESSRSSFFWSLTAKSLSYAVGKLYVLFCRSPRQAAQILSMPALLFFPDTGCLSSHPCPSQSRTSPPT